MAQAKFGFDDVPGGAAGQKLLSYIGPTILVDMGFDPTFDPKTLPSGVPISGVEGVRALVDTGAAESCIDSILASSLNLPITDRKPISGIHGSRLTNMHMAQIHVPSLGLTLYGMFAGADLHAGGQPHLALLGRSFLESFTMVYEGHTGNVTLSSD
jgi:predicted aspartyl protease